MRGILHRLYHLNPMNHPQPRSSRPGRVYMRAIVFNVAYSALWLYRTHRFLDAASGRAGRRRFNAVLHAIAGSIGVAFVVPYLLSMWLTARAVGRAQVETGDGGGPLASPWRVTGVLGVGYLLGAVALTLGRDTTTVSWGARVLVVAAALAVFWIPVFVVQRHLNAIALGTGVPLPRGSRLWWVASPLVALASLAWLGTVTGTVHTFAVRGAEVSFRVTCNSRVITAPVVYQFESPGRGDTAVGSDYYSGRTIVGVIVGLPGDRLALDGAGLTFNGGPAQPASWDPPPGWGLGVPAGLYILRIANNVGGWNLAVVQRDGLVGPVVLRYTPDVNSVPLHDAGLLRPPASSSCQ